MHERKQEMIDSKPFAMFFNARETGRRLAVNPKTVVAGCEMADPIIALSYLELYAHSLGLGSLWDDLAATVAAQIPAVSSLFGIPEGCNVGFVLLLGKPAVRYPRTVQKKSCNVTVI